MGDFSPGRHTVFTGFAIVLLTAASAAAGARAGAHPTGTAIVDPVYAAVLAGAVPLATSRSGRLTWLWLAVWAVALSREPGLLVVAGAALALAFGAAARLRVSPVAGALVGALAVQVVLRWPPIWFQGATALAAAVAFLPCLVHGIAVLRPSGRRFLLYGLTAGMVGAGALSVLFALDLGWSRTQVTQGIATTEAGLGQLRHGSASGVSSDLVLASRDFAAISRRVGAWWTSGLDLVPIAAQQRRAVVQAAGAARDVSTVAAQQALRIDYSRLHDQKGTVNLAEVRALLAPVKLMEQQLTQAHTLLSSVRSPWLLGPLQSRFDRLYREVGQVQNNAHLADQALSEAPALLGGAGPRTYLMALLDTSENRGLGGLLVWYWEVHLDNGRISIGGLGDANYIRGQLTRIGGGRLTGPADYVARYGRFDPQETFIDASYSPDLPTVTQVVAQLYADAGHPHIDGMLVVDPHAMSALLQLTGPVEVPQVGQLNASNIEWFLDAGEYALYPNPADEAARENMLHQAMRLTADHLVSASLPGPEGLFSALAGDVRRGDIGFWSLHPDEQPLLRRTGLADAFPSPEGGDLLGVTTQNAANNKIDEYLHQTLTDRVSYDRSSGRVSDQVSVTLTNSAPASGLSYYVIAPWPGQGPPPGLSTPQGANLTWVTVYSPLPLASATLDGRPARVTATPELGVHAYSEWVQIDAGATAQLTFDLQGRLTPGRDYRMTLYRQPAVNPSRTLVLFGDGRSPSSPGLAWAPPDDRVSSTYFSVAPNALSTR